jgi:proline-specific peptidase
MTELYEYIDYSSAPDQLTGGIRRIPITTPKGEFSVWVKRVGNNPKIRLLLLHGGPGATHELYECFDGHLPAEGIEYIYYDQLDSYYSDQPNDPDLWTIEHFVDEVEQVRRALGLNRDNFFLYGQSWGGTLAIEYALAHQQNLKGLIISNMVSNIQAYNQYAQEVLGPQMPPEVLAEIQQLERDEDYENPRYEELLMQHHYTEHVLRMPLDEWPDSIMRIFKHLNRAPLCAHAGLQRVRHDAERQPGKLEPLGRPAQDRSTHAHHRRGARHHGPQTHGVDGRPGPARPLPALPERQPPGAIRRSAELFPGPGAVSERRPRWTVLTVWMRRPGAQCFL